MIEFWSSLNVPEHGLAKLNSTSVTGTVPVQKGSARFQAPIVERNGILRLKKTSRSGGGPCGEDQAMFRSAAEFVEALGIDCVEPQGYSIL